MDRKNRTNYTPEQKIAILKQHLLEEILVLGSLRRIPHNPLEGYRWLAFMMLDRDVVRVSPSTVYRVLPSQGLQKR